MASTYITHNVLLESVDFNILVIEFPEADVNEHLARLSSEKGLIFSRLYEDFVLSSCLANAGPFFFHVRRRPELLTRFADIRREVLSLAFKYSPGFRPENVVIDINNVLKTLDNVKPGEHTRPLVDNDLWDQDPPMANFGPGVIIGAPSLGDDDGEDDDDLDGLVMGDDDTPFEGPIPTSDNPFSEDGGSDGGVPFELIGHKWETPGEKGIYINVRQYEESEEALVKLLGEAPFQSARGYHVLIVERCIDDYSDVFHLLDKMGVTKTKKPGSLLEELYDIAIMYNPFLKLEDVDLKKIRQEYRRRNGGRRSNNRMIEAAGDASERRNRKRGVRFEDLPAEKLLNLTDSMKEKVVGQDEAIEHISDAIQRASVGLKRDNEPVGTFLFTGNTGVGKTETAKALAEVLGAHLVRVDCQEYQHSHEVAKLTGSPPGYVGYDDGGHLTKEVAKYPFSVVLFDEIEKAHSNFHERVLQIIDDGVLTESKGGRKVSFNQCVLVMTSNIGVNEVERISNTMGFGGVASATEEKVSKARGEALKKKFKPEFLNRIDEVVHFRLLERGDFMSVLDILLEEVQGQVSKKRGLKLQVNMGAKNLLLDKGIDQKFGARPLRRAIKKYLSTPLARAILKKELDDNSKVIVNSDKNQSELFFRQARKRVIEDKVKEG